MFVTMTMSYVGDNVTGDEFNKALIDGAVDSAVRLGVMWQSCDRLVTWTIWMPAGAIWGGQGTTIRGDVTPGVDSRGE